MARVKKSGTGRRRAAKPIVRRRSTSVVYSPKRRSRRRLSVGGAFNKGSIMNVLEAAAGGIAAGLVKSKVLPLVGMTPDGLTGNAAGLAVSVLTGTMLKRPMLAAGMAGVFGSGLGQALAPGMLSEGNPFAFADNANFVNPFLLSQGSGSMQVPSASPSYY
ncbi:MAG: hypothetical protein VKL39_21680 [Leptolyngbyaceae bacterium]|nr:hypothetical protein [Leptolyngbyaceae bacterium]